jgi:hypothetical protein
MIQQPPGAPPDRFPIRVRGYKRRPVDDELAAIDSELAAAREKRDADLLRIRSTVAELGRAYRVLHEYEWVHAENPTRDRLACFVRYALYSATCEARSIEEDGRLKARAVVEEGEQLLAARRAELAAAHQDEVRRLEEAAARAGQLVEETVREFAALAEDLADRQKDLRPHSAGATS